MLLLLLLLPLHRFPPGDPRHLADPPTPTPQPLVCSPGPDKPFRSPLIRRRNTQSHSAALGRRVGGRGWEQGGWGGVWGGMWGGGQ